MIPIEDACRLIGYGIEFLQIIAVPLLLLALTGRLAR